GAPWKRSPSTTPSTHIATPPHSICADAPMNGVGMSRPLLQIEPKDHETVATSSAIMPAFDAPRLLSTLSQTTPTKPIPRPIHSTRLGCWPRMVANIAIHNGAEATATAAMPEDTDCSA